MRMNVARLRHRLQAAVRQRPVRAVHTQTMNRTSAVVGHTQDQNCAFAVGRQHQTFAAEERRGVCVREGCVATSEEVRQRRQPKEESIFSDSAFSKLGPCFTCP